jgi:predicted DNA-binding ribbon-helix-helix protein
MNYMSAAAADRPRRKSLVVKRSVSLDGHRTSMALEDAFWDALKGIATAQGTSVGRLLETIDSERLHTNLSSVVRLFVLNYYRSRCSPERPKPSGDPG